MPPSVDAVPAPLSEPRADGRPRPIADEPLPRPAPARAGWLLSPALDLLFVANIAWPLLLLVQFRDGFDGRAGLQFWQVYFVTTPHRWITLVLVFLDRERFREQRGMFLGLAALVTGLCLGVRLATGTLVCLLTLDYLWNAWHFAAQHHGVYRLYARGSAAPRTGAAAVFAEKWLFRGFLLYVTFRVAGTTALAPAAESMLRRVDLVVGLIPTTLFVREAARLTMVSLGRASYLASVMGLYSMLLWAVHASRPGLALALTTASAIFHAVEYLAVVGWSVTDRASRRGDRLGILGWLAPRWGLVLAVYLATLGSVGWFVEHGFFEAWLTLNVILAFLHYAYDGLIWRGPSSRPRTGGASSLAAR